MARFPFAAMAATAFLLAGGNARADPVPLGWSASFYAGPATTKYFGAALQRLNFEPTGVMLGLAVNRPFLDLGWDVELSGEAQVTQYTFGHANTSFAAGLGFQMADPFGIPDISVSVYDGPSYALDPPYSSIGYSNALWPAWRHKFLNYVSLEIAMKLPRAEHWDGVFRLYHRSGAFGIYSQGDDDGEAVGLGVRYRF